MYAKIKTANKGNIPLVKIEELNTQTVSYLTINMEQETLNIADSITHMEFVYDEEQIEQFKRQLAYTKLRTHITQQARQLAEHTFKYIHEPTTKLNVILSYEDVIQALLSESEHQYQSLLQDSKS